jgi:hypothetical protein
MFLFYRYYSNGGTYRIPYFSALCATVFLIYIHIFQVLIIFDTVELLPMHQGDSKILKYGKLALFLLPIFIIVWLLVPERDLRNAGYSDEKVRNGGRNLVIYIVLSIALLFSLALLLPKT